MIIWYDFVILALLIYTAWSGAQRGLVTQLAWIAALVLCFKFADKFAPAIEPQINVDQPLRHWIAMFILYLAFSLGSFMAARILHSWMEKAKFKDFDRHLGGIFGLLKGVVIALVMTFFAVTLSESLKSTVLQSRSGLYACIILDSVEPLTPEYFHEYLAKYQQELSPLQNRHEDLGLPSSQAPDLWDDGAPGDGQEGLNLPNLWNELAGRSGAGSESETTPGSPANSPTFDQLWQRLPQQMKDQFGSQLQQQWNAATPDQKRDLFDRLGGSMGFEVPAVVSDFLTSISTPNQSGPDGAGGFERMLNEIGDIYQNRDMITQRTRQFFSGVPAEVQQAVIQDWHADIALQGPDPDPFTDGTTTLDERILRQLDRAGVSWNRLSFELRQRLNLSRE